ncbi:MAG: hypothetical protein K6U02_01820 [Firmicutes bacterium]|nr:hypothetical protein [Bacillota bacterium]
MRRFRWISLGLGWLLLVATQQVVDRIIARIGDDILLQSELEELRAFQQLIEGRSAGRPELFEQLVRQWIVVTEAEAARFSPPAPPQVEAAFAQLADSFGSRETWQARLREAGLTEAAVRRLLERQLLVSSYLDYKFRPALTIEESEIERYYQQELIPQMRTRHQSPPELESVREQIRELLAQREISRRATQWLETARAQLRVEILDASLTP